MLNISKKKILSPGREKGWQVATVESILINEKYKGDALLKKSFTVDFLTKKVKVNEGEIPQYYVHNSHPAIIEPDEFNAVQAEMQRRKNLGRPFDCNSTFPMKIVCGDCGGFFDSKVWHSNSKYHRIIWRCNEKYKSDKKCKTLHVTEDEIREGFLHEFNTMMGNREELISNCHISQSILCDCSKIDEEIKELEREIEVIIELSKKAISENVQIAIDQDEFNERNNSYLERHRKATERIAELEELKGERQNKYMKIEAFIKEVEKRPLVLEEFDEKLWVVTVEKVRVKLDGRMVFEFKDGTDYEVPH